MDHVYSVFRGQPETKALLENDGLITSSLSKNNLFAFTSTVDLLNSSQRQLGVYVYVVDLNLPYFPYLVTYHEENITTIEWDDQSIKLLIGDDAGNIQIWTMCDFLISEWNLIFSHCFAGESILRGIWFHKGIKLVINYDKKDCNVSYQEKFEFAKVTPSVVQFGSKHTDGYLCLTKTGFVYAHLFCSDGKVITGYDFLSNYRIKLERIDIAYMKNGNFLVIGTNGCSKLPLSCYSINVAIDIHDRQKLKITSQPFNSFALNINSSSPESFPTISYLKFIVKDDPDAVIVCASNKSGSIVELWELSQKPVTFHSAIHSLMQQQNQKIEATPKVLVWKFNCHSTFTSHATAITTPHATLFETNPALSYIVIAFQDNTIKCFYRENLQMLVSVDLATSISPKNQQLSNGNDPNGYSSLGTKASCTLGGHPNQLALINSLQLTWSSCAMVAIDSHSQIFLFRLSPIVEPCTPMNLNYAQLMFEYSMLSGNDYWDILISVKPSFVETLCERITENFITKQSQSMQQKWIDPVLELKSTLYRCVNSGSTTYSFCKAGDYFAIKMLHAISETIKRLIRAREYLENEGPVEKLSFLIQNKSTDVQMLQVDKILVKLENKDFYVEHLTQMTVKHLLQWACDLSLYILASIPQQYHQNQYRLPGIGLVSDTKSLNTLRELLVIIRFWGLVNSTCLPTILKIQDNVDAIALIFKLLSKLVASSTDKFDESLVDDCCLLPNQVQIPQMDLCPKSIGIASPCLYSNSLPLEFVFGTEPVFMKYNVKVHTIDGGVNSFGNRKMDVVRYVALGKIDETSSNIRSCTRCSSVSLRKTPNRLPAARAWDQQWSRKCFCGGSWRVHAHKRTPS